MKRAGERAGTTPFAGYCGRGPCEADSASATDAKATLSLALDPQHLARKFDGDEVNQYPQWMFQIRTYMALVDVGYGHSFEDVESATQACITLPIDLELKKSTIMFHVGLGHDDVRERVSHLL